MAGATLVFVMLFIFIMQAGMLMHAQVTAANAAREGARAAATLPPADPYAAVARASRGFERQVSVQMGGDQVRVTVALKMPLLFKSISGWDLWPNSTSVMRRER
jgi:hypothetical protein